MTQFLTFSVVERDFKFQTHKNVLSQMLYDQIIDFGMLNGNSILLEQVDELITLNRLA